MISLAYILHKIIKRTLYITTPCHLKLSEGALIYTHKEEQPRKACPIDELGYVLLAHPHITLTQALLTELAEAKVAVVTCNEKHLPHALTLPLNGHYLQSERTRCQAALTKADKNRLWGQIIRAKIQNQVAVLRKTQNKGITYLKQILREINANNIALKEAQAARAPSAMPQDECLRTRLD